MKRVITLALSVLVIVSLFVVSVSAEAYNPVGGCKTETTIYRANAADVVKDGVIGENEYVEIDINRDPNTTDLMLSFQTAERFEDCCEFLNKVHFYISWDETHGLNVGVTAELLETPWSATPQPDDTYYADQGFPGDEFLFQFGMMFRVAGKDDETVMNRGIGLNTETNTILYGHYNENGYTGTLSQKVYEDYIVTVNGNTVTYEISFPIESVVEAQYLDGKIPAADSELRFSVSATGGSQGEYNNDANMYAISIGDAGYMAQWEVFDAPAHAKGFFSHETIVKGGDVDDTTASDDTQIGEIPTDTERPDAPVITEIVTTNPPTQPATTEIVTSYVTETDDNGDIVTDDKGDVVTNVVSSVVTQKPDNTTSPVTGDPMIIAAVVAAISACGVVVAKKRK